MYSVPGCNKSFVGVSNSQIFGNCHFYIQSTNKSWLSLPEIFMPIARVRLDLVLPDEGQQARLEFRFSSNHDMDFQKNSEIRVRKIDILTEQRNLEQGRHLIEIHRNLRKVRSSFKSGIKRKL